MNVPPISTLILTPSIPITPYLSMLSRTTFCELAWNADHITIWAGGDEDLESLNLTFLISNRGRFGHFETSGTTFGGRVERDSLVRAFQLSESFPEPRPSPIRLRVYGVDMHLEAQVRNIRIHIAVLETALGPMLSQPFLPEPLTPEPFRCVSIEARRLLPVIQFITIDTEPTMVHTPTPHQTVLIIIDSEGITFRMEAGEVVSIPRGHLSIHHVFPKPFRFRVELWVLKRCLRMIEMSSEIVLVCMDQALQKMRIVGKINRDIVFFYNIPHLPIMPPP